MSWAFRSDLYVVQALDAWIGLDIGTGRYLLFRGTIAEQIGRFTAKSATTADIDALATHRILERDSGQEKPFAPNIPMPLNRLTGRTSPDAPTLMTAKAAWGQFLARRSLAREPLSATLQELRRELSDAAPTTPDDCEQIAQAFHRARRLVSQRDQCLACSLAMCRMLARKGKQVRLIIGVTLPFIAHSWVQVDETVLSDDVDRVRPYVPILAV